MAATATPPLSATVVVPTHQRAMRLQRLLFALERQTVPPGLCVVVADGSTDATCAWLSQFRPTYPLVWRWQPRAGRGPACNRGAALATQGILIFLDDDMEPAPELVEAHLAEHRKRPRSAIVGAAPMVVEKDSPAIASYVAAKFNDHLRTLAQPRREPALRDVYTGNFSVPKAIFDAIGGFDETFTAYGHEDVDLCWRLRCAAVTIGYSDAAVAWQHYDKDLAALAEDNVGKGTTAAIFARKHPSLRDQLKLASLAGARPSRRAAIGALVALTRFWPATRRAICALLSAAMRLRVPGLDRAVTFTLDYCFVLGTIAAGDPRRDVA